MRLLRFKPGTAEGNILEAWWRDLQQHRGERAVLRRCQNLTEVVLTPSFHRLCHPLTLLPETTVQQEGLPCVAALAARVVEISSSNEPISLPRQMALASGDRKAAVSELRFRRLLQCRDREELFPALGRILRLLGHRTDLYSLAQGVYCWGDPIRREWAYDYFGVSST
ncbi:MAG: type I-E CRISPR-associated protein Cse2/CasB, partial [Magnetococcales bacterium]|nr:type I-E CRISPR-associated protein Cse2/CasB [Magnetococcales bacterium]